MNPAFFGEDNTVTAIEMSTFSHLRQNTIAGCTSNEESQMQTMRVNLDRKKIFLRSMKEQINTTKEKRRHVMKELFKIDKDKHSFSIIVLKDQLNHADLVEAR